MTEQRTAEGAKLRERIDQYLRETGLADRNARVVPLTGDASDRRYFRIIPADGPSLVLALHSMACVAGFIAGSSLPWQAEQHRGWWRTIHEKAGPAAIAFVGVATAFSLCTQAYVLGDGVSTIANQLGVSQTMLMLTLLPHALLELFALFLPLAAWLLASRRGAWDELLAATAATTAIAVPLLVLAANVEVFVWPRLLRLASPLV